MKRLTLAIFGVIVVSIAILISFTAFEYKNTKNTVAIIEESANTNKRRVILDAGHGGFDGGASSASGILEKDINLKIAEKLEGYLIFSGYDVIMTRKEDIALNDTDKESIRNKKRSDIKNRMKIANEEDGIFLSIHLNSFPETKYHGSQVFYAPGHKESESLAKTIKDSLKEIVDPENGREIKKGYDTIYLLKNAKHTAVLVECGFLSNPEEAEKLITEDYQTKLAFAIFTALERYNLEKSSK